MSWKATHRPHLFVPNKTSTLCLHSTGSTTISPNAQFREAPSRNSTLNGKITLGGHSSHKTRSPSSIPLVVCHLLSSPMPPATEANDSTVTKARTPHDPSTCEIAGAQNPHSCEQVISYSLTLIGTASDSAEPPVGTGQRAPSGIFTSRSRH